MGNDGGSIPKRRELVKEATQLQTASEAKASQLEQQEYCWTTCPLSQQPLKEPVVSDWAGNLYNKDAVIEFLLPTEDESEESLKSDQAKILDGRIKSLKDVQEVKFHIDESEGPKSKTSTHFERRWSCPVTSKPLGPGVKAVYLVPCGHAFEETAVRNATEGKCLQCEEDFASQNVVNILPSNTDERDKLVVRIKELKGMGLTHTLKKASGKKRKKGNAGESHESNGVEVMSGEPKKDKTKVSAGIKNADTASMTAKVQAELEEKSKRRKLDENIQSLYANGKRGPIRDGDFMTRGFTMSHTSKG